ncbi:hypothetical protein PPTG_23631 [Phytophthora nicotianae INRA-310]|uniref:Uncharacterized protein n=1 Tax=Phytophthora nicotianae (strain INRA-310) TaxID=761204 RepID=W2PT76_PHYN3|nr:hypothetical protein PPTG_23631 [Phytophthora nicotianae INRA-310]ETN04163.1 hypothetical protein PPTG_23631 [Phytophthora nicotianae INRA-310]
MRANKKLKIDGSLTPLLVAVDKLFRYAPVAVCATIGSDVSNMVNAFLLPKTLARAVCDEEAPLLRVFRKFRSPSCLPDMNCVSTYFHLEVVDWLLAHCSEKFAEDVTDWVAKYGHLHVVQRLHEDRYRFPNKS